MKYYKLTEHPYKKLAKIAMNKKCQLVLGINISLIQKFTVLPQLFTPLQVQNTTHIKRSKQTYWHLNKIGDIKRMNGKKNTGYFTPFSGHHISKNYYV